jgi:hypothetical protein
VLGFRPVIGVRRFSGCSDVLIKGDSRKGSHEGRDGLLALLTKEVIEVVPPDDLEL